MSDLQARERVRRTLDAAARDGISDNLDLRLDVLRVLAQRHSPGPARLGHRDEPDVSPSEDDDAALNRLRAWLDDRHTSEPEVVHLPEQHRQPWRRELLKLVAAALIFALVGALLVVTLRGSGEQRGAPQPTPTSEVTPSITATATLLEPSARISVGDAPFNIAIGTGDIWIPNVGDGTLARIDPTTNSVVAIIDLEATPSYSDGVKEGAIFPSVAVTADGERVWASRVTMDNGDVSASLLQIDPATNTIAREIQLTVVPVALAFDGDSVWIAARNDNKVVRVDLDTGAATATIPIEAPAQIAVGARAIWAIGSGSAVYRIDPVGPNLAATVPLDGQPVGLASDDDNVWVTTRGAAGIDSALLRIDPTSDQIISTFRLNSLGRVTAQDGRVWVNQAPIFSISEIDPASGAIVQQVRAGCNDGHLALDGETLWVTDLCGDTVLRVDLDGRPTTTNESEDAMFITSQATISSITRCATATAVAATLILSACGGGDDDTGVEPSPTPTPTVATVAPTATTEAVVPTTTPVDASSPTAAVTSSPPTVQVGTAPCCMAFAAGAVWVVNAGDSTIMRIDPTTSEVVATIDLDVPPADLSVGPPSVGVAASGDMVWAYRHGATSELVQIDPSNNSLGQPIALDVRPNSLAIGADGNLWMTGFGASALYRIDPSNGEVITRIDIPGATNMTAGGDSIWVETQGGSNSVARVDARTGEILATLPLDGAAWATGDDIAGWVTNPDNNLVQRIDLESNAVVAEIPVEVPALMAVGDGALWVGSLATGAIYRIDSATNSAVEVFRVAAPAIGMVVANDAVWVTDTVNGTVTRIDL